MSHKTNKNRTCTKYDGHEGDHLDWWQLSKGIFIFLAIYSISIWYTGALLSHFNLLCK